MQLSVVFYKVNYKKGLKSTDTWKRKGYLQSLFKKIYPAKFTLRRFLIHCKPALVITLFGCTVVINQDESNEGLAGWWVIDNIQKSSSVNPLIQGCAVKTKTKMSEMQEM